jgi:hypothetical protein
VSNLWYVAYGSNTSARYFRSRFDGVDDAHRIWSSERWVWLSRELYFAGRSQTWAGSAVAFVSLWESTARTLGRAFLIEQDALDSVLTAEHLRIPQAWTFDALELPIGGWCPLPTRAKYNAVLRIADIDDFPAFTITTARSFEGGRPSAEYLGMCKEGLAEANLIEVDAYLEAAIERSSGRMVPSLVPPRPSAPYAWQKTLRATKKSTGYPTVQLDAEDSWLDIEGPVPGLVDAGDARTPVWFLPPRGDGEVGASPPVFRGLGKATGQTSCSLLVPYATRLRRLPARTGDIEIADSIQVAEKTASQLGEWCLLVSPSLSGPVRVSPRERMRADVARLGYAARELWEFDEDHGVASLVPIGSVPALGRMKHVRLFRWLSSEAMRLPEMCLGAPHVPLRATEGVIGDEGHAVVRIDATALDFLGVRPGDEVIVSWARRETRARVLLQTPELRTRMRDQLAERTGRQSRLSTRAKTGGDAPILWHLQAWLSPSVREALVIPPDTVVRIRRSIRHAFLSHLLALELPVGGLTLAVLAIPDTPLWAKITVPIVALVLALVPLRVART